MQKSYEDLAAENEALKTTLVSAAFSGSAYIRDNLEIPADIAHSRFGSAFKFEGGRLVGYDETGAAIVSRSNPGEPASFDDAIERIVTGYAHRDRIMRTPDGKAPGGRAGVITRAAFDGMTHRQKAAHVKAGGKVVD